MWRRTLLLSAGLLAGQLQAADYLRDRAEVEALLGGATLEGVYLRTGANYRLVFGEDGRLEDGRSAEARWWVNELGQYCREWLDGPLAGNRACMDVQHAEGLLQLFHAGRKVAEGVLQRR